MLDKAYQTPSPVDSDGVDTCLGARYWAARSQTSGGTFVSQPGARNGIYTTLRDGTVTGTIAGLDRTLARKRPRPDQRGHLRRRHQPDASRDRFPHAIRLYRYLSQFKGKQGNNTQGPNFSASTWSSTKTNAYRDFVNSLGGERRSDYWVAPARR